jgi:steroid delta-isomerase-like uncharacterized protein
MLTEQNKTVVRRFIENFNKQDVETLPHDFADDYGLDFPGGPTGQGREGIRQATSSFMAAFPDLHFTIDDLLAEGDRVAWRWTMTGTHKGNLGPFPASGKSVRLSGISLLRLREGKIMEDKVRADMVGLLQQIGVIPAPGQGGS